jgi:hypothetical protein
MADEQQMDAQDDELDDIRALERANIALGHRYDRPDHPTDPWFMIESQWLTKWRNFVNGGERPGHIDNHKLLNPALEGASEARPGLKKGDDYRRVNRNVWEYFMGRYGGGAADEGLPSSEDLRGPRAVEPEPITVVESTCSAGEVDYVIRAIEDEVYRRGTELNSIAVLYRKTSTGSCLKEALFKHEIAVCDTSDPCDGAMFATLKS